MGKCVNVKSEGETVMGEKELDKDVAGKRHYSMTFT